MRDYSPLLTSRRWNKANSRYTHKTSGFKTLGFKTSGFKTSETSGLQNVRFTKHQVYKMSGLQNVRSSKRPVAKNSHIYSVLVVGGNPQVLSQPSVSVCLSLSLWWMSQPVAFLIFNYIITFLLYTNRSIPQCGCSAILI
jgi:hypothetical protein